MRRSRMSQRNLHRRSQGSQLPKWVHAEWMFKGHPKWSPLSPEQRILNFQRSLRGLQPLPKSSPYTQTYQGREYVVLQ